MCVKQKLKMSRNIRRLFIVSFRFFKATATQVLILTYYIIIILIIERTIAMFL